MVCPKCGSHQVVISNGHAPQSAPKNFAGKLIWWGFVVLTLGLVLLQPYLTEQKKTAPQAVCQVCGHIWTPDPAMCNKSDR